MSKLRLHGTSSGYTDIAPTAAAGNNTLTAPTGTGTLVAKDAAGAIGITSVQATNANFSGTTRITSGISTTLRVTTGISTTLQVGGVNVLNSDGVNTSGIVTAKTFVPTEGQTSHKNLVPNGAMRIAQRGTSFTANGYSLDQWYRTYSSGTAALTQSALTSGAPFDAGFRYTLRHTQPSSAMSDSAGAYVNPQIHLEAQDLANSGWNYKSASSYLTLSFWAKSSVAQTFYHYMIAHDGTAQAFSFGYTLAANTWKKIEVKIPGNSNLTFNDDNGSGLTLYFNLYFGTDRTDAGNTMNEWANWNSSSRTPVQTNTWFTTANATFDYTGVQLEVGSVATPFEHRSYNDDLVQCERYYQTTYHGSTQDQPRMDLGFSASDTQVQSVHHYRTIMRDTPTPTQSGAFRVDGNTTKDVTSITFTYVSNVSCQVNYFTGAGLGSNNPYIIRGHSDADARLNFDAEL